MDEEEKVGIEEGGEILKEGGRGGERERERE